VLFVDFGNVCATHDFGRFVMNFSRLALVPESAVEAVLFEDGAGGRGYAGYSPLFLALEQGEIGPTQFFNGLTRALRCGERIDYTTFAQLWVDVFNKENAELDALFMRLPHPKYLLSNINMILYVHHIAYCTIIRNHFRDRTQHVLSYDVGAIKPDPLIYKVALARAGINAEEALFIDDLAVNIEAWRALGGHGIVYHAGKNTIAELEAELRAFGVLT
jgi:FMN phosphatase YigB (HAD superfamily)